MIRQDLEIRVVTLWRQEEGSVYQWVAVEHWKYRSTQDTVHTCNLVRTQVGQYKAADFIISMWTLILHLDVVRILQVSGEDGEG
jgi:hypothetical protein